jgi:hypothetical protein
MLFFPNATIYVSDLKITKNTEGTKIKTYDFDNPLETFKCDVQPNTLTSAQIELYGIKATTANTKKCFIDLDNGEFMKPGNRAKVIYDSGEVEYYNIQPTVSWRFHKEFLLIPVENENG